MYDLYIIEEMLGFELVKFGSCYESQGNPRDEELKSIEHNCFHMPRYHFCFLEIA